MVNNSKQMVQDILPPSERSIRKIPLPPKKIFFNKKEESDFDEQPETNTDDPYIPIKKKKGWRLILWVVAFVVLLIILWSFTVNNATIKVTLKEVSHDFKGTLIASKLNTVAGIPFEVISVSEELSKELTASGEKEVERKASGEIVIFNKYSEKPQTLITNTRFESSSGLIYRISESVSVPGFTKKGSEIVPGQIKVRVYAGFPGEEYNIGLTDFTVPGFKGMPQFNSIFARSAESMVGGLVGKIKIVDEATLKNTVTELQNSLSLTIKEIAITKVPPNFILIPQSLKIDFQSMPQKSAGDMVEVREKITASGIILNREFLEKAIVAKVLDNTDEDIKISNLETLTFDVEETKKIENLNSFEFDLSGKARFLWKLDEEALTKEIAGHSKPELPKILSKFEAIKEAVSSIKPFWKRNFPKDPKNIKVEISTDSDE